MYVRALGNGEILELLGNGKLSEAMDNYGVL